MLAFAGRLTAQKDLGVALEAMRELDGVRLLIAGDGPERARLEAAAGRRASSSSGRCRAPRCSACCARPTRPILTSAWENFPHGVVEALAVGTPVIATRTGGVAEVVRDGENGLLVEPGRRDGVRRSGAALPRTIRRCSERLRAAAAPSVAAYDADAVYGRLESILREAAR